MNFNERIQNKQKELVDSKEKFIGWLENPYLDRASIAGFEISNFIIERERINLVNSTINNDIPVTPINGGEGSGVDVEMILNRKIGYFVEVEDYITHKENPNPHEGSLLNETLRSFSDKIDNHIMDVSAHEENIDGVEKLHVHEASVVTTPIEEAEEAENIKGMSSTIWTNENSVPLPLGSIFWFTGPPNKIPDGYKECDGEEEPSNTKLGGFLGGIYGERNANSLRPNVSSSFIRAAKGSNIYLDENNEIVDSGGVRMIDPDEDRNEIGEQEDEFLNHKHSADERNSSDRGGRSKSVWEADGNWDKTTSSEGGSETRPKNIMLIPIMKAR